MLQNISQAAHHYLLFYQRTLLRMWNNMTPVSYGCLLIGICIAGFLLMKSGQKK